MPYRWMDSGSGTSATSIETALWAPGSEIVRSITLNGETYYFTVVAQESASWSGIMIACASVGITPTTLQAALYNDAGTKIGAEKTGITATLGGCQIPFTAYTVTKGTQYIIGINGTASTSTFRGSSSSDNNTATNRTGAATLGVTVPAGVSTANRLVGMFY